MGFDNKKNMQKIIFIAVLALTGWTLAAQSPVPAAAQAGPIAIVGATAHLGNGQVIENVLITLDAGKITRVDQATAKVDLSGYTKIDATGKHVYPGFIAANTQLGLVEIGAVNATHDESETGDFNPNTRALIAYNTDSQVTPTVRSRGVLYAQTTPQGSRLSGSSSIVQLDAWNWEDAAVLADDGLHLEWPRRRSYNWRQGEWTKNERYDAQVQEISDFLNQSRAYCATSNRQEHNLRLAATCGLFNGQQRLFVHADLAKDMEQAVLLGQEFGLQVVIVGGGESYLITDLLKTANIPVILGSTQALPATLDSDVDQPYKTPAQLAAAGVQFCLSHEGYWQQRNLPFQAGTAVAYGLPYERAVQAITLDAARILGVADRLGSLETGKDASLIITTGDALDMRTSNVEVAFIAGRQIDLDNKQATLYRKFKTKYDRGE